MHYIVKDKNSPTYHSNTSWELENLTQRHAITIAHQQNNASVVIFLSCWCGTSPACLHPQLSSPCGAPRGQMRSYPLPTARSALRYHDKPPENKALYHLQHCNCAQQMQHGDAVAGIYIIIYTYMSPCNRKHNNTT